VKGCPICHRHGWFTDAAVADHVDKDHPRAARRCTKRRYRTSADALDALISTNRKPREKRREHRRYQCGNCGGWHLTSMGAAS
jgi:hypothetical protein